MLHIFIPAKVGIKSCRMARKCVSFYVCMDMTTQVELCLHEQTQILQPMLPVELVASIFLAR